jgi:hypothetical protein
VYCIYVAEGRGYGLAVVNTGVNLPVPQKAVSKGLLTRRGGGEVACDCTAILNLPHFHCRKGKFYCAFRKYYFIITTIIIIVIFQLSSNQ